MIHSNAWKRIRLVVSAIVIRTKKSALIARSQESAAKTGLSAKDVENNPHTINARNNKTVAKKCSCFVSLKKTQAPIVITATTITTGMLADTHSSLCGLMNDIQE